MIKHWREEKKIREDYAQFLKERGEALLPYRGVRGVVVITVSEHGGSLKVDAWKHGVNLTQMHYMCKQAIEQTENESIKDLFAKDPNKEYRRRPGL